MASSGVSQPALHRNRLWRLGFFFVGLLLYILSFFLKGKQASAN